MFSEVPNDRYINTIVKCLAKFSKHTATIENVIQQGYSQKKLTLISPLPLFSPLSLAVIGIYLSCGPPLPPPLLCRCRMIYLVLYKPTNI